MKKSGIRKWRGLLLVCLVLLGEMLLVKMKKKNLQLFTQNLPECVETTAVSPANLYQCHASAWFGSKDGKLYFYTEKELGGDWSDYSQRLWELDRDGIRKLPGFSLKGGSVPFSVDGKLFYTVESKKEDGNTLFSYQLETAEETRLYESDAGVCHTPISVEDDGSFTLPMRVSSMLLCVRPNGACSLSAEAKEYQMGDAVYYLEKDGAYMHVFRREAGGEAEQMGLSQYASDCYLIPYQDKLLVWSDSDTTPLYWIDKTGNITAPLKIEGLRVYSTITTHGDFVYVSFIRYKEYGEIGMRRFEEDTVEGTYQISFADGTVTKLNDWIFDGMYCFDDTGIYCCTSKSELYFMDFSGNVLPILAEKP